MNKLAALARMNPGAMRKVAALGPLSGGLLGAGLGGGLGAGYAMMSEKDPQKRKEKLKTAIMAGALIGGTGGAALGLASSAPSQEELGVPGAGSTHYTHPGAVMLPATPWALAALHKAWQWSPRQRFINSFRAPEKKTIIPESKTINPKAILAAQGLLSAGTAIAVPDVVRDVAKAQASGDTGNVIVDAVVNPFASVLAYMSNRPWGRKVLSNSLQPITSNVFGVNLLPDAKR